MSDIGKACDAAEKKTGVAEACWQQVKGGRDGKKIRHRKTGEVKSKRCCHARRACYRLSRNNDTHRHGRPARVCAGAD